MSEFHDHLNDYDPYQQPQTTNGMAIASLVCSLIICCPLVTILGPILGAISLSSIGSPPRQKGKGLAMAGIIIGLLTTVISVAAYWQGFRWMMSYIDFVMEGPQPALQSGYANDLNGFRAQFHGAGATATDEQVQAFLNELEARYGTFLSAAIDEQAGGAPVTPTGAPNIVMPYILQFRDATVSADVELHFADEATGRQLKALGYIHVYDPDPERDDLRFPPSP